MTSLPQPSKDGLGDRMKAYELEFRTAVPLKTWTVIRLDGRAFHTWTKGLDRPYSEPFIDAMADAMTKLCEEISNVVVASQHSDELSIIVQDFAREETQPWYGGQIQKIASVSASLMTAYFGRHFPDRAPAIFDARVFTLPNRGEVSNYLLWRNLDCLRNSVSAIASSMYSPAQLHSKSTAQRREMIEAKGWREEDADPRFMRGQVAYAVEQKRMSYVDKRTQEVIQLPKPALSRVWKVEASPILNAQADGFLLGQLLPADPDQSIQ